jgi:hypothetical protein
MEEVAGFGGAGRQLGPCWKGRGALEGAAGTGLGDRPQEVSGGAARSTLTVAAAD